METGHSLSGQGMEPIVNGDLVLLKLGCMWPPCLGADSRTGRRTCWPALSASCPRTGNSAIESDLSGWRPSARSRAVKELATDRPTRSMSDKPQGRGQLDAHHEYNKPVRNIFLKPLCDDRKTILDR